MYAGAIGGFVVAMITIFKSEWAGYTTPIYALLEGLFLGGISALFESMFPGIVFQAIALTFDSLQSPYINCIFCQLIAIICHFMALIG